ncbi:MAG: hypothetical protein CMF49_07850 [Legionellales bacterium]|nr:hypothetical protein [Legionellales bacterium]|tara:strand:+ start:794 stop:1261 length:468 start_codon:yes stop_codon:yes gene_type:complete
MTQNNLLSQLKDIHQPTPVSWWPPAIGWYLLVIVICITAFIIGKLLYKRWRKYIRKKCALAELKQLKIAYQNTPDVTYIAQAAVLLKRVMMIKYTRTQVASLTGERWLKILDFVDKSNAYTQGIGRELLSLPYQKNSEAKPELFILIEKTIRRCL